jgi:hypothetical protein
MAAERAVKSRNKILFRHTMSGPTPAAGAIVPNSVVNDK